MLSDTDLDHIKWKQDTPSQLTLEVSEVAEQAKSSRPGSPDFFPLGSAMIISISTWTSITTDSDNAQRLLALYFCWDYPIFGSVSKEHFVEDFLVGRTRYCSSILVNVLLALGCCFLSHQVGTLRMQQHPSGDAFFDEAKRLLATEEDYRSLTTIQALGIMSIRESSCGRDSESYFYSQQSILMAVGMGTHNVAESMDSDESAVTIATFWGAFELDQAWSLATHTLPSCSIGIRAILPPKRKISVSLEYSPWICYNGADDDTLQQPQGQISNMVSVYSSFCELSELSHETLYVIIGSSRSPNGTELVQTYAKYLSWYNLLPDTMRLGYNSTPAVLFAQ